MKTGIFYFSLNPGPDRQPIRHAERGIVGYVRVVVVDDDLSSALDGANPKPDESVMNTHEVR